MLLECFSLLKKLNTRSGLKQYVFFLSLRWAIYVSIYLELIAYGFTDNNIKNYSILAFWEKVWISRMVKVCLEK